MDVRWRGLDADKGRRRPRGCRGILGGLRLVSGEEKEREKRKGSADAGSCPLLGVLSASGRETREKRFAAFRRRGKTCRALHPAGFFIRSLPSRLSLSAPAFHRFCPVQRRTGLAGCRSLGEHRRWGLAPRPENVTDSKNAPPPCQGGPDRRTGRPDARPLHLAIPSGLPPGHGIAGKPASERRPRVRQAALAGMPACAGRRRLPWG